MYLRNVQQNQGSFSGSFSGLGLIGPLKGTVTTKGDIQFTVPYQENLNLSFSGTIKIGGDIVGAFYVLNQQGNKTGESGLWSGSPNLK